VRGLAVGITQLTAHRHKQESSNQRVPAKHGLDLSLSALICKASRKRIWMSSYLQMKGEWSAARQERPDERPGLQFSAAFFSFHSMF
jgi:hypothetical protein